MTKFVEVVIFLVHFVVLLNAYDFENAIYNKMLLGELEELEWSDYEPTSRKNIEDPAVGYKCEKQSVKSCCDENFFQSWKNSAKSVRTECYKELQQNSQSSLLSVNPLSCKSINRYKREITCLEECVARKMGLLGKNNELIKWKVEQELKKEFSKLQWLSDEIEDMISRCLKKRHRRSTNFPHECNINVIDFDKCLWKEIQEGCPKERIKDVKKCKAIKEGL